MRIRGISAALVTGLTATLIAAPVAGQEQTELCLTVSVGEDAGLGSPVMVRDGITSGLIEVVSVDECTQDAALDALSDAEHFGVFMGHALGVLSSMTAMRAELRMIPQAADAETWLAELAGDPDAMAAYVAQFDRTVAFLEDEVAWLEAHPPRPCWAESHEAWRDRTNNLAANGRIFSTALRAQDVGLLVQANADLQAIKAGEWPDLFSLGQACWPLPAQ
jgi:hypothetical protein